MLGDWETWRLVYPQTCHSVGISFMNLYALYGSFFYFKFEKVPVSDFISLSSFMLMMLTILFGIPTAILIGLISSAFGSNENE